MGENIAAESKGKEMLRLCDIRCPHMQQITLQDTLASLRLNIHQIEVPADIAAKGRLALERMISIGPGGKRG